MQFISDYDFYLKLSWGYFDPRMKVCKHSGNDFITTFLTGNYVLKVFRNLMVSIIQ